MNILRVTIVVAIFLVGGCASQTNTVTNNTLALQKESSLCHNLDGLTWEKYSLYDVTYTCMPKGWEHFFNTPEVKASVLTISQELDKQIKDGWEISPSVGATFRALYMVPPTLAQAVILGQDPAPQPGLATGLSFSLPQGTPTSDVASVQRVFLEANNEGICTDLNDGDASQWAENNVLLLNMALTIPCPKDGFCKIAKHVPLWEDFTGYLMAYIDTLEQPMSFILWGSKAKAYASTVKNELHKTFEGGHPSPKAHSSNFFCKNYFNCANNWLVKNEADPINWNLGRSCQVQPTCEWEWDSETRTSSCTKVCEEVACPI
ncbi:uracil-DNA glycosylase [Thalassotalea fusca]